MALIDSVAALALSGIVSVVIIYAVTKLLGEKEGLGSAVLAAVAGSVIYTIAYALLGGGLLAAVIGGVVWLAALSGVYSMGFAKSLLVAILIWVAASAISMALPTLAGPI